jgi:hypothetical protein
MIVDERFDDEDIDDLASDIEAEEARHPGYRQRLDELGETFRLTTALWQERERRAITVEQLAARAGLPLEAVEAIEDNALDVPYDHLVRYGRVVGLRFDVHHVLT